MKTSLLKIVSISSKDYKKQLLLKVSEVDTMTNFLKGVLKNEVMVINTNLALDVYYRAQTEQFELIKDAFLLVNAHKKTSSSDFHFRSFASQQDIFNEAHALFLKLSGMPLFFKSYSKSLFHQMSVKYESNRLILLNLFAIWQTVLLDLNAQEVHRQKFKTFLTTLQKLHITYQYPPDFRSLLEDALETLHVN